MKGARVVRVLVGQGGGAGGFKGFWAEFEGEEISTYKDEARDKNVVYTLYKCPAYNFDAYRVHIADESNHQKPVYELLPYSQGSSYAEAYVAEDLAKEFPLFLKDIEDYLKVRRIDPA